MRFSEQGFGQANWPSELLEAARQTTSVMTKTSLAIPISARLSRVCL
jgi:hypothetical protein